MRPPIRSHLAQTLQGSHRAGIIQQVELRSTSARAASTCVSTGTVPVECRRNRPIQLIPRRLAGAGPTRTRPPKSRPGRRASPCPGSPDREARYCAPQDQRRGFQGPLVQPDTPQYDEDAGADPGAALDECVGCSRLRWNGYGGSLGRSGRALRRRACSDTGRRSSSQSRVSR